MSLDGLSMICAGLGIIEEDDEGNRIGYAKSESCSENLKDLLRFLRRDDPNSRDVFKQVCKWNIVSKDLIPIMSYCQDDSNLVLNTVKVLVFLTMPTEPTSIDIPEQIEYLWGLKSSFTCSDTLAVVVSLLETPLENLEQKAFTEDDWKLVQLVLTLFRNILAVQEIPLHQKSGESTTQYLSIRDKFLELLFRENVMDLIIVFTQHISGYLRQDNLLLLEIFHYIFMGQEPEFVAKAHVKSTKVRAEAETSLNNLKSIMKEEEEKRRLARSSKLGRHTQFNVAFTRVTMDGSKTLLKGNPCSASHSVPRKSAKVHHGRSKPTVWDHGRLPSGNGNVLELLHDFMKHLLSGGYNVLMQSVREDIEKEHHAIEHSDVVAFFHVAQFATSFQYHKCLLSKPDMDTEASEPFLSNSADSTFFKGNVCGPIAASMNEPMFLLVISKWRHAFEGLKETNNYNFLSSAGSLVKSMIRVLDLILKLFPEHSKEPQTARILLYKLFYDQTEQGMTHFLLGSIKSFNTHKQPKRDLADLVEMIHVIVRLMEKLQEGGSLRKEAWCRAKRNITSQTFCEDLFISVQIVCKKSRKVRKKKPLNDKETVDKDEVRILNPEQSVDTNIPEGENTQDASVGRNEQEVNVPVVVRGPESIGQEAEEPATFDLDGKDIEGKQPPMNSTFGPTAEDLINGSSDSSSDSELPATVESDLKVTPIVSALVNETIIHNLCWLLSFYKSNSPSVNHYILCTLKRICEDLELSPMLYQLSLLNIFHSILAEQKLSPRKEHKNIVDFLTSLVRKLLKKLKTQPLLFVELLFWKTRKECHYINSETLYNELSDLKKQTKDWGSTYGYTDTNPFGGEGRMHRSIADALGDDEADLVTSPKVDRMRDWEEEPFQSKSRRHQNHEKVDDGKEHTSVSDTETNWMGNDVGQPMKHEFKGISKRKRTTMLDDKLAERIKVLYEKYKDDRHCSRLISENLDPDTSISPVQVTRKLKVLGLKVPSRKRAPRATSVDGTNELTGQEEANGNETMIHNPSDGDGSSALRKPQHTSKRVNAFSKEQESTIKALFEQLKDHKRCSYMIAKALDSEGSFTAGQVSRKLKQLGLRVPRQKNSEAFMKLQNEDFSNNSSDNAQSSGDETLLSLRNRKKFKTNSTLPSDEISKQKSDENISQDVSEDELLSSVFEKTRKPLMKEKGLDRPVNESRPEAGISQDTLERNEAEQDTEIEMLEEEETDVADQEQLGLLPVSNTHHSPAQKSYHDMAAELEDSDDDGAPIPSQEDTGTRRKVRMVIDYEDEE